MSHFQRSAYQVAQHFTHEYPGAPLRVHPVQPLMPMEMMYSGAGAYGVSAADIYKHYAPAALGGRKSIGELRKDGANTAVYAAYDNISDLDAAVTAKPGAGRNWKKGMTDLSLISTWADMSTVAASDSAALLKSAYMMKLAGLVLGDSSLVDRAKGRAENALKAGEAPGSGRLTKQIAKHYLSAEEAVRRAPGASGNAQVQQVLTALQIAKDPAAVGTRVKTYREEQETIKADIPFDEGGEKPDAKCEDSWKSYIPGLCRAEAAGDMLSLAVKIVGGVAVAGVAFWGIKKVVKGAKSVGAEAAGNPRRMLSVRSNPSAPGRTDYGPEEEIAQMPKARAQEQAMMKNVFKRKV